MEGRGGPCCHFNRPDEYSVVFTANATARQAGGEFVLTSDNHNSVNGIREFARLPARR